MRRSNDNIEHEGVVVELNRDLITVEIESKSACSSCHAKGACSLGDTELKIIEIEGCDYASYEVGERVNVLLKRTMGYRALWISYLFPLIILMVLLVSLSALGLSEPITGLGVIGGISVYYIIIWIIRDKLKRDFVFTIEKLNR